jgi:hypothetical protein
MEKVTEYLIMLLLKVVNLKGIAVQYAKKSRSFKTIKYLDTTSNEIAERGKKAKEQFKKEKNSLYYIFQDEDPNISYITHKFKIWSIIWYNRKKYHIKNILTKINKKKKIIMAAKKYTLTEYLVPFTKGREIISDLDAGGIKLTYSVKNVKSTLSQRDVGKVAFLKPYKKNWGTNKKDVGKNEWGNTFSPYSNVWLQINEDYKSYSKEIMNIRYTLVKDSNLISQLNKQTKEFVIGNDEEIREIPLMEKIKFNFDTLLELIKMDFFHKKSK